MEKGIDGRHQEQDKYRDETGEDHDQSNLSQANYFSDVSHFLSPV